MKFGVATISLPDLLPNEAAAAIVAEGFTGVEWRVRPMREFVKDRVPPHPFFVDHRASIDLSLQGAREAAQLARDNKIETIGLSPYIEMGDLDGLNLAFAMAVEAGAPQIRLQAPRPDRTGSGYSKLYAQFLQFFKEAANNAASTGVVAALEIHHKTICPSAALAHRVLCNFDPAHVGAIYDIGNLVWEGYENHEIALELLGSYLRHVHVKNAAYVRQRDGRWNPEWTPIEEGIVDVPHVLKLIEAHGFDKWVSVEELSLARSPREALRHNARKLRDWKMMRIDSSVNAGIHN